MTHLKNKGGFSDALSILWERRKSIGIFVGAAVAIAIIASLLLPTKYASQAVILPELEKGKLVNLAAAPDIASLVGVNVGEMSISKLYPVIIRSERLLGKVLFYPFEIDGKNPGTNLLQYWRIDTGLPQKDFEAGLKRLQRAVDVVYDNRVGTVTVIVELDKPQLAADVANQITTELDEYIRRQRRTNASAQREFIEERLKEVGNDLEKAEDVLKDFRSRNRRIADSPDLLLQEDRLIRTVQINSAMFIELKKQYEIAKIEEVKNVPIINILDKARPPYEKSKPNRTSIVLTTFALSTLMAIVATLLGVWYRDEIRSFLDAIRVQVPVLSHLKSNKNH